MSMSPQYRSMIYFAMGTLHLYRADISPEVRTRVPFDPERFIEKHRPLIDRIAAEGMNLFNYELSHEQMCRAVTAYFSAPQHVVETKAATL